MGKNDFLTPKAIGNRIKAKGLQKLRWYCQMCQKQCRDENGFKCHLSSESHKRQMDIFGQNPARIVEGYSEEFERTFLEHLKQSHPFSRIAATVVYNEYINDKHHVHMNSTKWLTLTDFVKYLGREGKCKVDETPKGWFIALIHRDELEEIEGQKRAKRDRAEQIEEDRHNRMLREQIERAKKLARTEGEGEEGAAGAAAADPGASELRREQLNQPLGFQLAAGRSSAATAAAAAEQQQQRAKPALAFEDDGGGGGGSAVKGRKSKVEELMEKDRAAKSAQAASDAARAAQHAPQQPQRLDHWLAPGIVVKVLVKKLPEYYKKKGVVLRVLDKYRGEIEMTDSGDVLQVDQKELETVVPQPGGAVLVVNGLYRGAKGSLVGIDTKRFQAEVKLRGGAHDGQTVWLEYEDFSRWHGTFK
ncbi:KIN17-like protein [Chlorella vulgaris]